MKRYAISEIFHTIQGEGFHAGKTAVFVRFAGCNLWSGVAANRERDAERNEALCPRWCDTDFAAREHLTATEIADRVSKMPGAQMIVLTGGEPLLQLDLELVLKLSALIELIAVETNGTQRPPPKTRDLLWLTLSPKVAPDAVVLRAPDEIKVVFPDYDPILYLPLRGVRTHLFVQPRAQCAVDSVGRSIIDMDTVHRAATFVLTHPEWRLSLQTHKLIGVP